MNIKGKIYNEDLRELIDELKSMTKDERMDLYTLHTKRLFKRSKRIITIEELLNDNVKVNREKFRHCFMIICAESVKKSSPEGNSNLLNKKILFFNQFFYFFLFLCLFTFSMEWYKNCRIINSCKSTISMKYFKLYLILYLLFVGVLIYLHWWFLLGVIIFLGVVVGFIIMLAFGVEAGFRGKYPMDFLIHTNWLNDYFYRKGFDIIDYDTKDSDNPQTILRKDNEIIKVRLNAPLTASTYFYEIITEGSNNLSLKFPVTENQDKIINELDKYFDEYPIVREQNPEMEFYGTTFSNKRPNTVEYQNDNSSFGELSGISPSEKNGRNET